MNRAVLRHHLILAESTPMKIKKVEFIKSTLDWADGPPVARQEIALVGRSNVGKSSMLNVLINMKNYARVSKQPGKTRTINYFEINEKFYLVDLPGYGYAKISKAEKKKWGKAIEGYLQNSPRLLKLLVLIDGRVGAKDNDIQLVEWLRHIGVPFQIVVTKIDKVSKSKIPRTLRDINLQLGQKGDDFLLYFSAKKRIGREPLLGYITDLLRGKK